MLGQFQNSILWLEPLQKNNQSAEQIANEWACPEYTERSTDLLAEPRESVISIICSMSILVALETPSLMANSSASGAVVLPAGALEDDTWWPSLQKCAAEIAYMFLGDIALASVTTTRVGRDLVFRLETASQATQRPQAPMLGPFNIIHGSAESAPQLGRECDMTGQHNVTHDCDLMERDSDTSSHTLSHSVTRDSVTHNVIHDTDLWDSDMHFEADAQVLFFFFFVHQFITRCSVAVRGRLSTTSSLQF